MKISKWVIKFLSPASILFVIVFLFVLTAFANAAGTANSATDLIPPQITIISPEENGTIVTSTPRIEVSFVDLSSGIDQQTIHLILDQLEITAQATVETTDVTGQALVSPLNIHYQPSVPLAQGTHEVFFSVRDKAGNLAERRWKFEIKTASAGGIQVGGTNTFEIDDSPLAKTTDTLDFGAQTRVKDTDLQFHLSGHATDFLDGTTSPNFNFDGANFYLDKYSLGVYHQKAGLIVGYATSPLDSELLQLGYEIKGGVVGNTVNHYNWAVFSGKTSTSDGLYMTVYDVSSITGGWTSPSGTELDGFYVNLGDNNEYSFTGMKGTNMFGKTVLSRFEVINGVSKVNQTSGNGLAIHFDKPINTTALGFDYTILQSAYPILGRPSSLYYQVPSNNLPEGVQQYGIRSVTTFGNSNNLSFAGSFTEFNLIDYDPENVNRKNINLGYDYTPDPGFNFNANYQGDIQYKKGESSGNSTEVNNTLLLSIKKFFNQSTMQTSLSLGETRNLSESNQTQFFAAWTQPFGAYNLTPSIQWSNQNISNRGSDNSFDTRLTLDTRFNPDLPRSTFALFRSVSNDATTSPTVYLTKIGLETNVYLLLWHNSSLNFTFSRSYYSRENSTIPDGWNLTLSCSWKMVF
jgi:hypothetical protein